MSESTMEIWLPPKVVEAIKKNKDGYKHMQLVVVQKDEDIIYYLDAMEIWREKK